MLNSAVNTAAGPWLSSKCVESWGTAKVGTAYPVQLPNNNDDGICALADERVKWVIQVLGPNMNRNRPDCLDDDYRKGVKELRKCYEEVAIRFVLLFCQCSKGS